MLHGKDTPGVVHSRLEQVRFSPTNQTLSSHPRCSLSLPPSWSWLAVIQSSCESGRGRQACGITKAPHYPCNYSFFRFSLAALSSFHEILPLNFPATAADRVVQTPSLTASLLIIHCRSASKGWFRFSGGKYKFKTALDNHELSTSSGGFFSYQLRRSVVLIAVLWLK